MSKISTYPSAETPLLLSDRLIGTEAIRTPPTSTPLATKNFSLGELLQLFSANFPAASLQAVLNTGNTATQNITLVGTITSTLIKPTNIEDTSGSQGTTFQFLSKGTSSINWVNLPVDNLQAVLNAGNTATQNITLVGNITSTRIIPGNIQDDTAGIGTTGQILSKTASGIRWINSPTATTPGLADVLSVGNTATNNINLTGNINASEFIKSGGTSLEYLMADGSVTTGGANQNLNDVLTVGNTSLLNAYVGEQFGLWDNTNSGYMLIKTIDNSFVFEDSAANKLLLMEQGITSIFKSNSISVNLIANSLTVSRNFTFPDASGTIALTSDIPSLSGYVPYVGATNDLDLGSNDIYANEYNFWDPAYSLYGRINLDAEEFTFKTTPTDVVARITYGSTFLTGIGFSAQLVYTGLTANRVYTLPNASGTIALTSDIPSLAGYVPTSRTLTINGTTYDLTANRTWTIPTGTGTVTSVGLSMPSAFTVSSSPITTSGTIAVTGAGVSSQYVRGDGTLANFPTSTGGGASVSYYLNGSVSQGTIGGVAYKEMNSVPVIGAGTDFTINADGYIAQFITDVGDPNKLLIPSGNWNFETYFSASSGGGTPRFYIELYKYDGTTFTLIASNSTSPEFITGGTSIDLYFSALAVPPTTLTVTDRLAVRFYVIHSGRTITMHTENSHLSQVITTFSSGLTALNGLTSQVQYLAVGTSGTDFNISSATDTHTFNLPTASATNRGALSSTDWSTFNGKFTLPSLTSGSVLFSNGTTIAQDNANFFWDDTNNRLGIGTNTGVFRPLTVQGTDNEQILLRNDSAGREGISSYLGGNLASFDITTGGTFRYGPLTMFPSTGSITFTGLDLFYGNITSNFLPKRDIIGFSDSLIYDDGTNVGIGTIIPTTKLDVNGVITATGGNSTSWNAKQDAITLTTTGTSGPATLVGATLNIPQYSGGGGGSTPVKLTSQTLAVGSWTLSGGYYTYAFSNVNVTTTCDVSVTPQNASYLTAYNAQVLPFVGVASGVATFYSQFPPQANMTVDIVITQTT